MTSTAHTATATATSSSADHDLREAARRRLEARAGSWRFLALWAVLAVLFVVIWAATSPGGYFWPVWPDVGIGIGVAFSFLESSGSARITEDRVAAEMVRLRG